MITPPPFGLGMSFDEIGKLTFNQMQFLCDEPKDVDMSWLENTPARQRQKAGEKGIISAPLF